MPKQKKINKEIKELAKGVAAYAHPDTKDMVQGACEVALIKIFSQQRQEIKEDLQTVIHMLEGSTATREQIANYIKRYLLKD